MRFLISEPGLDRADRIQLYLSYALQLLLLGQAVWALATANWLALYLSSLGMVLSFLPALVRRSTHVYLPIEFDLLAVLFVFATLQLGEIRDYYTRYWWWDLVLHTVAGFMMGLFGFILVYVLNREQRLALTMSPVFVGLFSFAFAITLGVFWEVFEFAMDTFFGMNMQKSGLRDTMGDLIVNTIGAAVVSVLGYFYVRGGDSLIFDRMVRRFLERNRWRSAPGSGGGVS
jgi:hypothetical protein